MPVTKSLTRSGLLCGLCDPETSNRHMIIPPAHLWRYRLLHVLRGPLPLVRQRPQPNLGQDLDAARRDADLGCNSTVHSAAGQAVMDAELVLALACEATDMQLCNPSYATAT